MLRHTLLLIYRHFKRSRGTFLINLAGLSTGLACALLIYLWVNDEWRMNRFNRYEDRLYQVMQNSTEADGTHTGDGTPGLLGKALADEMPEVEQAVSVAYYGGDGIASLGDKKIKAHGEFATRNFFQLFAYPLEGDKNNVLADKNKVAISKDLALRLYGTSRAIGKVLEWTQGDKQQLYSISGVFEVPRYATEKFDLLFQYDLFLESRPWLKTWTSSDPLTFVRLKPGADADAFNRKLASFVHAKDKDALLSHFIQPFTDRYLYDHYENGKPAGGRIEYVRLFVLVGVFILVIACINFMNLSTARATRRMKEVGIKKTIGAQRTTLALQYLMESMLMTFLSLAIAVLMTDLLLTPFNLLTGKNIALDFDKFLVTGALVIVTFTGLLAGSYPALYLSGFRPAAVLKGKLSTSAGERWTRKGLVVFQFLVSVVLIVCVMVVYAQMQYIHTKNLGYSRDHLLYFETENVTTSLLHEIRNIPGVVNAARFYHDVTGHHGSTQALEWEGKDPNQIIAFSNFEMGYDLVETMGFEIVEGRSFSEDFGSIDQIILNEASIDVMGLKDPIGKFVNIWGFRRQIVGVVKNFNYESLHAEVKPCFFFLVPMIEHSPARVMVKLQAGSEQAAIVQLRKLYQQSMPGVPFDYAFVDDDYQKLYASEQRVAELSKYFAGIAVVISCLGLLGLATFTAERRLKEIGIRKILGSGNFGIVYLLSGEFTRMVLIAIAIAWPVSYWIAQRWLDNFVYKTSLHPGYFAGAGSAALIIAWLTVGLQTIRAARVNPAQCLKEE